MCTDNNTTNCNIKVVDPTLTQQTVASEPFHMTKALMGEPVKTSDNKYEVRVKYVLGKHYDGGSRQHIVADLHNSVGGREGADRKFTLQGNPVDASLSPLVMGRLTPPQTKRWVNVRVTKGQKIFIGTQLHETKGRAEQAALRGNTKVLATVEVAVNPHRTTVEGLQIVM